MYTVILVIHTILAVALIGIILVQRSSTDGFGLSGNSSSSVLSGQSQANLLTRMTAILAASFIGTSLVLGVLVKSERHGESLADKVEATADAPAEAGGIIGKLNAAEKTKEAAPAVPVSE